MRGVKIQKSKFKSQNFGIRNRANDDNCSFSYNTRSLQTVIEILQKGGTVAYPTETAYGLGGDPFSKKAINAIFRIKKRSRSMALPLIASSRSMVQKWCVLDALSRSLAKKYWPGPLTLILSLKTKSKEHRRLAKNLGSKSVAIRVSGSRLARSLSRLLGSPIISTSANISGKESLYRFFDVEKEFFRRKYQPDFIISVGDLPREKPTTIVDCRSGEVQVVRQGDIVVS